MVISPRVSHLVFGDPAAGLCEDASARLREHPALLRLLNLAPVLVLEAIWIWICPLAVMRTARRDCNPVTECDCVRSYAAPDPPFGAAHGSSPIISQGTPIRSICALTPVLCRISRPTSTALKCTGLIDWQSDHGTTCRLIRPVGRYRRVPAHPHQGPGLPGPVPGAAVRIDLRIGGLAGFRDRRGG